ncbi:MAG: IS1634 family transposase, partial [Selenomonadaceae bacterium]|nr:IS1634 family transposase [Selenomonadaceae bacterium]
LGEQNSFNIGYLFLQQIYYQLRIPSICRRIAKRNAFAYDLDAVLSRLVYGRILFPSSKRSCLELSPKLYEQPQFEIQHVYRALSVLAKEMDFVQAELYKNSKEVAKRSDGVLYYDCTNYFFETESEEGLKQYGCSKEHRPSPIVGMGLFMDRSGLPLAFSLMPGNQNEQLSLQPLEKKIMRDFGMSKFVVCTDSGLSSEANRKFNNWGNRCFITTQSIKKMKKSLRDWALDTEGWHLPGSKGTHSIKDLEDTPENRSKIFYKQRYVEGYDEERDIEFNQTLIVTFSLKYRLYQRRVREGQIERAMEMVNTPSKADRTRPNDARRFVKKTDVTKDGEIASIKAYSLDHAAIEKEERFDGFYAVCTNLDDDPEIIVDVNRGRWEIEESFRIMKTDFEARPVYLKRDDRIAAHFLTCFIALLIYRILEMRLNEGCTNEPGTKLHRRYTSTSIIRTLREMDMTRIGNEGYIPSYRRTELTDAIHEISGFRTDFQLSTQKSMQGFCRRSKGL